MIKFLYLEIALVGIAILLIVFLGGRMDGRWRTEQRVFNILLLFSGVILATDGAGWMLEGQVFAGAYALLHLCAFAYHAGLLLLGGMWALYCHLRISGNQMPTGRGAWFVAPCLAGIVLLMVNFKTGWWYWYDQNNFYHRGQFYFTFPLVAFGMLVMSVVLVINKVRRKSRLARRDEYALLVFLCPALIGAVFQLACYGISSIPICIALGLLLIYAQRQKELVTADGLTGLSNYRAFSRLLERKIAAPPADQALFLMVLDANKFKAINDNYGHQKGNEALLHVSAALKKACRRNDALARIGGDEFTVLGQRAKVEEVDALVEDIHARLNEESRQEATQYRLEMSIGYVVYDPVKHPTADVFFQDADRQMYKAKKQA